MLQKYVSCVSRSVRWIIILRKEPLPQASLGLGFSTLKSPTHDIEFALGKLGLSIPRHLIGWFNGLFYPLSFTEALYL